MSTFMQKPADVQRKWYIIDAAGKPLGRVAAEAAVLLRGKHKTIFTPHVDCGDHVIIINCAEAAHTHTHTQSCCLPCLSFHVKETSFSVLF